MWRASVSQVILDTRFFLCKKTLPSKCICFVFTHFSNYTRNLSSFLHISWDETAKKTGIVPCSVPLLYGTRKEMEYKGIEKHRLFCSSQSSYTQSKEVPCSLCPLCVAVCFQLILFTKFPERTFLTFRISCRTEITSEKDK